MIRRDDRAFAGGVETIPFGILVFISFTLLVFNLWAVIDARMVAGSAAREYVRAYTEAADRADARRTGAVAAATVMTAHGRNPAALRIDVPVEGFGPCERATVTVTMTVPAVRAPFVGSIGASTVSATSSELVDAYRSGGQVSTDALAGTDCEG